MRRHTHDPTVNPSTKKPHSGVFLKMRRAHRLNSRGTFSNTLGMRKSLQRDPDPNHCSSEKIRRGMTGKELRKERKKAMKARMRGAA